MRISDWSSDVCSSDLLIGGVLMIFTLLYARAYGYGKQDGVGKMPVWRATSHAGLALFMPVVILGGIYGGIFTPTEASVVAVFYAWIVGAFIYRKIKLPPDRKSTRLNSSH